MSRWNMNRLAIIVAIMVVRTAHAGLQWESQELTHEATPDEERVVEVFRFTNTGQEPVVIIGVSTSCNCSTAELEKKEYGPGESGDLEVVFNIGNRSGEHQSLVRVGTDESPDAVYRLTLNVNIPNVVTVQPRQLWWYVDEPGTAKNIMIEFNHESPVYILDASSADSLFRVDVVEIEPGTKYQLSVRPEGPLVSAQKLTPITITTDLPYARHQTQTVYIQVAPKRGTALPVRLEPGLVWWELDEPPKSKTIRVTAPDDEKSIAIESVDVSSNAFSVELKVVEAGKEYQLIVTPADTSQLATAMMQLKLDAGTGTEAGVGRKRRKMNRPALAIAKVINKR